MSSYSDAILGFKDGADCLFVTINFIRARVVWEERISIEKIPSSDWPVAKCVGGSSLLCPRQVALGCLESKVTESLEQASQQHSSVASASDPASRFLPCDAGPTSLGDGIESEVETNLFFPSCFWSWCLSPQQRANCERSLSQRLDIAVTELTTLKTEAYKVCRLHTLATLRYVKYPDCTHLLPLDT